MKARIANSPAVAYESVGFEMIICPAKRKNLQRDSHKIAKTSFASAPIRTKRSNLLLEQLITPYPSHSEPLAKGSNPGPKIAC